MEVIYTKFKDGNWVNRGFLIGPICPIYGSGCILMILFLSRFKNNFIVLFLMAIAICSILEYLTGLLMEKLFNARWWDYSDRRFNINGRICAETMIPFGVLGCLLLYVIDPIVSEYINLIPVNLFNIIAIFIIVLFVLDCILSFSIITKIKQSSKLMLKKGKIKDNTEEITKKVKEYIINYSKHGKRIMMSFPQFKVLLKKYKKKD